MEQVLVELHGVIESCEQRLTTVVANVPPSVANTKASAPSVSGSHVFERLAQANEALQGAIQRLRELVQRVEV
jgi:hypothetical protein